MKFKFFTHLLVLFYFNSLNLFFLTSTQGIASALTEGNNQQAIIQSDNNLSLKQITKPDATNQTYLLIKLSRRRVYFYKNGKLQTSYPIAIGKAGWETPVGTFEIIDMQRDPVWENPFTGKIIPPGRNNPLGVAWIGFWTDGINQIGFHGTYNENLVGQPVSHGCIRMRNRDILKLYEQVNISTLVKVVQ
jgi:L,D-transpeptidase ErfK/SrfK